MPGIDDGEACAIAHFLSLWQSSDFERTEDAGVGFFMMISFGRKLVQMASFLAIAVIAYSCSNKQSEHVEYAQDQKPVAAYPDHNEERAVSTWNRAAAATYLDQRETWWMKWQDAKRDQGTFCVSCHTNLTFVFAQTALRELPTETNTSDNERKIIDDVKKRVQLWSAVESYYDNKEDETGNGPASRATEAVLNAVVLAFHDSQTGELSDDTRAAFKNMWALQQTAGKRSGSMAVANIPFEPLGVKRLALLRRHSRGSSCWHSPWKLSLQPGHSKQSCFATEIFGPRVFRATSIEPNRPSVGVDKVAWIANPWTAEIDHWRNL